MVSTEWLGKSGQPVKWISCVTAAKVSRTRSYHDEANETNKLNQDHTTLRLPSGETLLGSDRLPEHCPSSQQITLYNILNLGQNLRSDDRI